VSWEENEKFVLKKLNSLEQNQRHNQKQVQENHDDLSQAIDQLDQKIDESMKEERRDLKEAMEKQDVTGTVSKMKVRQNIIGTFLFLLAGAVMYLHFGFRLIP
jgi:preprotein translocase subunit SecF